VARSLSISAKRASISHSLLISNDSLNHRRLRSLNVTLNLFLSGLWLEIERTIRSETVLFLVSPAIVPRSSPTSESLLPHPTNVLKIKHSQLAFRTFPLPMKNFSSLLGHFGKGRKVPSSISFRSKRHNFVPCLNPLKVILPVLPSLSGKIFESRERYYYGNFIKRTLGRGISLSTRPVSTFQFQIFFLSNCVLIISFTIDIKWGNHCGQTFSVCFLLTSIADNEPSQPSPG
jgi:hypothetical protein